MYQCGYKQEIQHLLLILSSKWKSINVTGYWFPELWHSLNRFLFVSVEFTSCVISSVIGKLVIIGLDSKG